MHVALNLKNKRNHVRYPLTSLQASIWHHDVAELAACTDKFIKKALVHWKEREDNATYPMLVHLG